MHHYDTMQCLYYDHIRTTVGNSMHQHTVADTYIAEYLVSYIVPINGHWIL